MAKERSSETRFQIYEDPKGSRGENAQNIPEDETNQTKPDKATRRSTTRLPSINPDDHIMDSIEHSDAEEEEDAHGASDRAYSGGEEDTHLHGSPRISHSDSISEFPEERLQRHEEGHSHSHSPYTPVKQRSPFRHTSSVRAIQMDVTPPFNHSSFMASPLSHRHKFTTPSRNSTPRSIHSQSGKSKIGTPSPKKEYPLVLLHVTLLPITFPFSLELMTAVLPPYIIENYNLLKDKATDTVLQRGILVPHPREDYELLEERLLESLELKLPRILQCGHFHREDDEECASDEDRYASEDEDADICDDCGRRVRNGRLGAGAGCRRWSIKIFAANGLMRAGAWGAAWREMERVDVEIEPWIPEDLRRELDLRRLEMEEAEEERQQEEAEEEDRRKAEEEEEARREGEETVQEQAGYHKQSPRSSAVPEEHRANSRQDNPQNQRSRSPSLHGPEPQHYKASRPQSAIPSAAELAHTAILAAGLQLQHFFQTTDKKNVAIAFLSVLVLVLSLNGPSSATARLPPPGYLHMVPPIAMHEFPATTTIATTTVTVAVPVVPPVEKHTLPSTGVSAVVEGFVGASAATAVVECAPVPESTLKSKVEEAGGEGQLREGVAFVAVV